MREIMRSSIPSLVGWSTMLNVAMQRNLEDAKNFSGNDYVPQSDLPF